MIEMRFQYKTCQQIAEYFGYNSKRIIKNILKDIYINGISICDPFFIHQIKRLHHTQNVIDAYNKYSQIEIVARQLNIGPHLVYNILTEFNIINRRAKDNKREQQTA